MPQALTPPRHATGRTLKQGQWQGTQRLPPPRGIASVAMLARTCRQRRQRHKACAALTIRDGSPQLCHSWASRPLMASSASRRCPVTHANIGLRRACAAAHMTAARRSRTSTSFSRQAVARKKHTVGRPIPCRLHLRPVRARRLQHFSRHHPFHRGSSHRLRLRRHPSRPARSATRAAHKRWDHR